MNDKNELRDFVVEYSKQVIMDLAPEEEAFIEPMASLFLESDEVNVDFSKSAGRLDSFMGIGGVELLTALAIPLVIEVVKVALPILAEKKKKKTVPQSALSSVELELNQKTKELSLKIKGKHKKEADEVLKRIHLAILKELEA
jgi:hypothetical protein